MSRRFGVRVLGCVTMSRGESARAEEWNLTWGCDLRFQNCAPALPGRNTELKSKGSYLGLYASVIREGRVSEGDDVVLV